MQREIDNLKKKLRHAQRKQTPSSSDISSNDEEDASYRQRSRTPPSEPFSYDEEHHHWWRYKSSPRKGLGSNVEQDVESNLQITFHAQDREGKTSSVIPLAHIHHLQWSNGPCRTCEPVQPEDGYPL